MNLFKMLFGSSEKKNKLNSNDNSYVANSGENSNRKNLSESVFNFEKEHENLSEEKINELINGFVDDFLKFNSLGIIKEEENFEKDKLFEDAALLIVMNQIGSLSLLQRRMKLGYNRANRILDQLYLAGIIGPENGSKSREVFIKNEQDLRNYLQNSFYLKSIFNKKEFYNKHQDEIESRIALHQKQIAEKISIIEKDQIKKKLLERERKKQIEKNILNELIEEGLLSNKSSIEGGKREIIPQDIMDKVWNRDGGKCIQCGSNKNIEFDHIIPFSKGGATTYRNLQILCKECNIKKSNNIG